MKLFLLELNLITNIMTEKKIRIETGQLPKPDERNLKKKTFATFNLLFLFCDFFFHFLNKTFLCRFLIPYYLFIIHVVREIQLSSFSSSSTSSSTSLSPSPFSSSTSGRRKNCMGFDHISSFNDCIQISNN